MQNRGTTTFTDLAKTGRKRPRPDLDVLTDKEMVDADDVSQPAAVLPGPSPELPSLHAPEVPGHVPVAPAIGAPPATPSAAPAALSEPEPAPSEPFDEISSPGDAAGPPATFDSSMAPLPYSDDDEDLAEPALPSATTAQSSSAPPVPSATTAPFSSALSVPSATTAPLSSAQPVPSATTTSSSITTPTLDSAHPAFRPPPKDESFNARRMRLDRQKTLSFIRPQQLSQQPPAESRDRSRSRNADETVDHVFNVDVLTINNGQHEHALEGLPAGWFAKDGSLHLEEIHDWWEIRKNELIRHRDTLFRPDETGDCPLPLSCLAKDRVTVRGRHRHVDRWRLQDAGQVGWWTGCTVFKIQHRNVKEAEAAFSEHSGGSLVYAGTRAKRAKDAKNLNEKVLSLSDRIAFVEAKRKELESFFTNQVCEFSNLDDAPPSA